MDLFGGVIAAMVATGCILVVGGLYLIASGALKLAGDKDGSTNFKFGDLLQVGTTVPGLGIFMIGMLFELAGLYYANQARIDANTVQAMIDSNQVQSKIAAALADAQNHHAMKLSGVIKDLGSDAPVIVKICLGDTMSVQNNMGFSHKAGPYLDSSNPLTVELQTAGAPPISYMIAGSDSAASVKASENFRLLNDGAVDMGDIHLKRTIDLSPAIANHKIHAHQLGAAPAAGHAYGAGS